MDLNLFVFVANATAVTMAMAMFFLVLWQAPRHRDNQLMAAYFLTIVFWSGSIFAARLLVVLEHDARLAFYTTFLGAALNGFALFALSSHYAGLWQNRWVVRALYTGALASAVSTSLLYDERIVRFVSYTRDGLMHYELTPLGYLTFGFYLAFGAGSVVCLWVKRGERAGALLAGAAAVAASMLLNSTIPALRQYPLPAIAAAISSVLFARAILREKLFNPIAHLNRELAEANQRLREGEANLFAVIENTSDAIWAVDRNYRLLTFNSAIRLFFKIMHGIEIWKGMNVVEDTPPHLRAGWKELYDRALRGERLELEHRQQPGGAPIIVETFLNPIRTPDGAITGVSVFARDITARKQSEEDLRAAKDAAEAASRAKSEFLANMSHELRTPLNAILGYAQILKRSKGLTSEQRDGLTTIQRSGEHLLTLITDVLDLSKIEAQKVELQLVEFDLRDFLRNVTELFQVRAEQRGIAFRYATARDLPRGVRGDERRLRQVLINLLGNAMKFTEKGAVTLGVERMNGRVCFEIEDTGIGIAPEQMAEIFRPFHQLGRERTSAAGTGLGLAISRNLVQLMGGELQVRSAAGMGSVFSFAIDLPEVLGWAGAPAADHRAIIGYAGEPRTVLIVDDDPESRSVLANLLSPLGFHIVEASDAAEALMLALQRVPHVVLLDLVMPSVSGLELLRQLRSRDELQSVPVIATTARAFEQDRQATLQAGCDDFLTKPVRAEDLFRCLQRRLDLQWIHEDDAAAVLRADGRRFECPPETEVSTLLELARMGDIEAIQSRAAHLEKLDPRFQPLAAELRQLAKRFRVDQIAALIQEVAARR